MLRYLICVADPSNPADRRTLLTLDERIKEMAGRWITHFSVPECLAAAVPNQDDNRGTVAIREGCGVVFGSLYKKPESYENAERHAVRHLDLDESKTIQRSFGRSLIDNFWGDYVAVVRCGSPYRVVVLRGPVAPLACLRISLGTLHIFFSYVTDYTALGLDVLSINWDAINAQVVGRSYITRETGFNEVHAVDCGTATHCTPIDCTEQVYWHPKTFLTNRLLDSLEMAATAVRQTTDYCVNDAVAEDAHVLVNLSGGLDSSIVLSAAAHSRDPASLTAINYFSRGSGDERSFARSMANHVGCRLIEQPRNERLDLRCLERCNRTVQPVLHFSAADVEVRNSNLANELGASVILDGELGDNVFGSHPGIGALLECLRAKGLGRSLLSTAIDYGILTRHSLWRVGALAYSKSRAIAQIVDSRTDRAGHAVLGRPDFETITLATADAEAYYVAMNTRFIHPWLQSLEVLAPGAQTLIIGLILVTSTAYHSPFERAVGPVRKSPLISQPLAEVSLRIPSYLHVAGGVDRAVARSAFAGRLPDDILNRGLGKGGPTLWIGDIVQANLGFIREFLLDGVLVKRKILDKAKVEKLLSNKIELGSARMTEMFAQLYIEAWLRVWRAV